MMMKTILLSALAACTIFGCNGGSNGPSETSGNRAPTVFVGDDRTVAVGSTVTLDGSNCSDSDGDALTYDWRFAELPRDSNAVLSDNAAVTPDFIADVAGDYIIELTVSDGSTSASDSVIITAAAGQNVSDCSGIVPGANTADDFVCAHNAVRQNAQPAPSPPLPEVTWDTELAQIAQDYADKCIWGHNPHRSATYPGYVGENIYITTWRNSTPETAVQAWADEDQFYDYDAGRCQDGEVCGHYTQIVWRTSVKVGCARAFCPSVENLNFTNADYYVCNYAPGGNWGDEKPY